MTSRRSFPPHPGGGDAKQLPTAAVPRKWRLLPDDALPSTA